MKRKIFHKKRDELRVRDRRLLDAHPYLKFLSPEARKRAILKVLRAKARNGVSSAVVKRRKVHAKRMRHFYRPPRPDRPLSHPLFDFKFEKAMNNTTTITGLPGPSQTTFQQVITDIRMEYLSSWSSVNGDRKHPNPHQYVKTSNGTYVGSKSVYDRSGNGYVSSGVLTGQPTPLFADFDTSTYNSALGRLYDSIRGDVDLSIDFAEAHKSRKMIADTLRGMANLATTFRKMRRSNPKDWGNLWLEFTYGWKPLASSIYGTADRLMKAPTGPRYFYTKGSAKNVIRTSSTSGNGQDTVRIQQDYERSYRCKVWAQFAFTQSALDSFAGFTSLNPVSIAWELTPYSFVVDWFVDVGGYLRNFENALLYRTDFVSGFVSESWKSTATGFRTQGYTAPNGDTTYEYSTASSWKLGFRRTPLGGIPFPRAPRFDPKLGTSRLISAAALLGQLLPGRKH